jgi:hypothetical protein
MPDASGFLPVCFHDNKLMFLFGLESPVERDSKGWSDFAGGMEVNENNGNENDIYKAGLREFAEETSGFLGDSKEIDVIIRKNGGVLKHTHQNGDCGYHIHLFRLDYDVKFLNYYNTSHKYLYNKLSHKLLESTKSFEKIEIGWFTIDQMKRKRGKFRKFYRNIVDYLVEHSSLIEKFLKGTMKKNKRITKKKRYI